MPFNIKNIGRRQFISVSSMALAAGMVAKPSGLLFAADNAPAPGQGFPPSGGMPSGGMPSGGMPSGGFPMMGAQPKDDGTKYGKYIVLGQKSAPSERGIMMVSNMGSIQGCDSMALSGMMPPPGPMPGHETWERHAVPEYLIHLGNDPDDPMDLGADAELYLGKGRWRERFRFNKTTAVYLPAGMPHCPWHVTDIKRSMTFVDILVGLTNWGANDKSTEPLSAEELSKAKTGGYLFDKYLISGAEKDMKDPKGGKWLAYTDCTKIASAPLTRIIRYRPEGAPYSIFDEQTHEYGTFLMFLGINDDDASVLGAEIELFMGAEKEKHTFNKSALVWVPPNLSHGPLKVVKADRPFNFLEITIGPELPR